MMSSSRKKAVAAGSILVNAAHTRVAACSAATAAVIIKLPDYRDKLHEDHHHQITRLPDYQIKLLSTAMLMPRMQCNGNRLQGDKM
jgi:hypothetical protein